MTDRSGAIAVKQQRIDEDVFMAKRKEVLALWAHRQGGRPRGGGGLPEGLAR